LIKGSANLRFRFDNLDRLRRRDGGFEDKQSGLIEEHNEHRAPSNGSRLSCGALKKDSFYNLRAPSASSAG